MAKKISHINAQGNANMVDVSDKKVTSRIAIASGKVIFPEAVFKTLAEQDFLGKKGSILQTAIVAGIQAVKRTSELIPLCHQIALSKVEIDIQPNKNSLVIICTVKCTGQTGVEMEALTGVSVSALTIYDMCKALSHEIGFTDIQLDKKTGGQHDFSR